MRYRYISGPGSPSCSIFGHTPDKVPFGVYPTVYRAKLTLLLEGFIKDTKDFIVGLKPGVDLWCAAALMDYKRSDPSIRIFAYVIGPAHDYSDGDKILFRDLLDGVDSIKTYDAGADYKQRRARDMAIQCTKVLAIDAPQLPLSCAKQAGIPIVQYSIEDIMSMFR